MRFGILNQEEELRLARSEAPEFEEIKLGIWRKERPDASEKSKLALWMLQSLGIVETGDEAHPAVTIFLELMKRRHAGEGVSGAELVDLVNVGKTQTYYWLNKMKQAKILSQGKKTVIERGAKRELKGFYLSGPDLGYTLGEIKKHVNDSLDDMISVSERLQQVIRHENSVAPDITQQGGSILKPPQSGTDE